MLDMLRPANYGFDEEAHIFTRTERRPFPCPDTDGSPDDLWNVVNSVRDRSTASPELFAAAADWRSQYHLSPYRANLLRPFAPLLGSSVLEVGCGCGAITRFLGEHSADVVAVEGDWRRARIAAARCAGLPGVSIYCDNFRDFSLDRRFQTVTCIGALRRSPMCFTGSDPAGQMLRRLAGFLAPDGYLLIAVENRLALKYFSGAPEESSGIPFQSLEDLLTPSAPVRCGRREWERLLRANGLEILSLWYPFPDYKLPGLLVSAAAFEQDWLNLGSLLRGFPSPGRSRSYPRLFPEVMVWPVLVNNGVAEDFASSFLIVARRADGTAPAREAGSVLFHYSTNRLPAYAVEMSLRGSGRQAAVCRRRLYPEDQRHTRYRQVVRDEPYIAGELFSDDLYRTLNRSDWKVEDLAAWAGPWVDHLRAWSYSVSGGPLLLPPNFLDYTPFNLVRRPDGTLSAFDLEYVPEQPLPLTYLIFRGLWATLVRLGACSAPAHPVPPRVIDLVFDVMRIMGFPLSADERKACILEEAQLQSTVTGISLRQAELNVEAASLELRTQGVLPNGTDPLYAQLYWQKSDVDDFSEGDSFRVETPASPSRRLLRFLIPPGLPHTAKLRLDLANRPGLAALFAMRLLNRDDVAVWEWNGDAGLLEAAARSGMDILVGAGRPEIFVYLHHSDPQLLLPAGETIFPQLEAGGVLEVEFSWLGTI